MKPVRLCHISELEDSVSRGFECEADGDGISLVVIRQQQRIFGYINSCPHTGASLEWLPHQFLDISGSYIQCAMHGALFSIDDGLCIRGPCSGESLKAVNLVEEDGVVYLVSL